MRKCLATPSVGPKVRSPDPRPVPFLLSLITPVPSVCNQRNVRGAVRTHPGWSHEFRCRETAPGPGSPCAASPACETEADTQQARPGRGAHRATLP